jgi:iron-sulfur cluster assembly protein
MQAMSADTATPTANPTAPASAHSTAAPGPALIVTSRAAKVMREQLARRGTPQAAIRLGIRGGGCTGYSYLFEFDDREPRASDHVVLKDGVRVHVDPKSMLLLKGTEVDFETGIRGHGFKFTNPNVKDSCGCGESITF